MKVLITGGAGYIGSHVNRYLNEKNIETVIIDDLSGGHKEAILAGDFIQGDFGNKELLDRVMTENKIDAVMHMAASASVGESVGKPNKYYHNNVVNMKTLLDACVEHSVCNIIFSSSAATFGLPKQIPMDEKHPQDPINPYGTTKLIGEKMLAEYDRAYGLHYCAFRYFNAAGGSKDSMIGESHNPENHLIPVMINAVKNDKAFSVFGTDYNTSDGSASRDYVHVLDIADAHYLGMQYIMENKKSDCFNLGSTTGFTVLEMLHSLEDVTGLKVPYKLAGRRAGDPDILVASNEKAKAVLGWNPVNSDIRTILQDAWNWANNRKY